MNYYYFDSPVGILTLGEENNRLAYCLFGQKEINGNYFKSDYLTEAYRQLQEYFNGDRHIFELNYLIQGTAFQQKVCYALLDIPYGQTISYKQLAINIGSPQASRAVGRANHENNITIFIPCHRVVGSDHRLVGYAGGLEIKEHLLKLENASL
ncbi:MAG: methylated-DNA--[protein]-cysteine S-methyltransferase [Erysipelotrichaceae bacterium]|nr:methylated-DNA--[protein]-cysteine S-methyltransferase [Erysipelotrichaceae bacterium]